MACSSCSKPGSPQLPLRSTRNTAHPVIVNVAPQRIVSDYNLSGKNNNRKTVSVQSTNDTEKRRA